ncbi:MAG TPA: HDIG domain-containing protein [Dehalococcoidia bacterium]|nr:HDIG domain-containing protein [Dehalococcoidia bacterium]
MRREQGGRSAAAIVAFTAALAVGVFAILFPIGSAGIDVQEGERAPRTVQAPRDASYESEVLTQRLRDEAAASVQPTLVFDAGVADRQLRRLDEILAAISSIRSANMDATQKSAALTNIDGLSLSPRAAVLAVAFTEEEWSVVEAEAREALAATYEGSVGPTDLDAAQQALSARVQGQLGEGVALLVEELARPLVVPNQIVDEAATERAREEARARIAPAMVDVVRGEVIIREGETVDSLALEKLERLELLRSDLPRSDIAGVAIFAALFAATLGLYVAFGPSQALGAEHRLPLLGFILLATAAMARFGLDAFLPDEEDLSLSYVLPLAAAPMLTVALVDIPAGLLVAALTAVLAGFAGYYHIDATEAAAVRPIDTVALIATVFLGGVAGAFATHRAQRLNAYLLAGLAVAGVTAVTILVFWLLDPSRSLGDIPWFVGTALGGGVGAALLTIGALALAGSALRVTTSLRLMELAQLEQPLLRRLREEAPGTFHHSVIVSGLAERAAEAIGADALLVRVGCYYHDIGKTLQPRFYIENQGGEGNPHDELDPEESARIIIQHVLGGEDLARRQGLPDAVRAFIREHHGRRLVTYFYHRAAERDPEAQEGAFRYPGPRPQSRETAIVMLADSTEAVVRSATDRSPERIDELVDSVIAERLTEGELDESDLTLRNLADIARAFKATLRGVYHPRIEYPSATGTAQQRAAEASRGVQLPMPMDGVSFPTTRDAPIRR